MLKVGLTGGIGSGKSTVCTLFARLGVPVIDTDELARLVVTPGSRGLAELTSAFGDNILQADGTLDRAVMRELVFNDSAKRTTLEGIVHPLIRSLLRDRLSTLSSNYVIIAIPLLLEKNWQGEVDRILVVDCSEELQRQRVSERDGSNRTLIDKIIRTQVPRQQRLAAADDIIHNDNDMADLIQQVEQMHQQYLQAAANH